MRQIQRVKQFIFRPDIDIGLEENTEKETGAYIPEGNTRNITIQIEGVLPENEEVTLSCNNSSKISLWEGSNQKSFPYTCSISQLPKTLTLKGEQTSNTIKDITLTLTTSKGGEDKAKVTVFSVDIVMDNLDEIDEENEGSYIFLNWDDDNENNLSDRDESGDVIGENDLVKVNLQFYPSDINIGILTLKATVGADKIKIWQKSTKVKQVLLPISYDLSHGSPPAYLWVEGYNKSDYRKDIELRLSLQEYYGISEDKVKLTVVNLKLGYAVYRAKHWENFYINYNHTGIIGKYIGGLYCI